MTLLQSGLAKSLAEDYTIDNSLRFDDGDTPYMSWTPSAANSVRTKWTISAWVKLGNLGTVKDIFSAGDGAGKEMAFGIGSDARIGVYNYTSGDDWRVIGSMLLRDPSAWYHILCRYDSTDVTTNDRVQLFVNGERLTALDTNTQPSSSFAADFWSYNGAHYISSYPLSRTNYMDGYLAEVYSIDGTAYTASDFGELSATTNQWIPKDASDLTFGTNGFYQKYGSTEANTVFDDSSSSDHTITAVGSAVNSRAVRKIGDSSIYINNGAANHLSTPDSSDFMFGTGDFTLEMWVYPTSLPGFQYLMGQIRTDGTDECFIRIDGTTNKFRLGLQGDSSGHSCIGTSAIAQDTWTHLAAVRDDETLRVYVNGVQENTTAFGTQSQTEPTAVYFIGAVAYIAPGGAGSGYDGYYGYMDEVRVSNTCRYPDGTTFTPSTTAFTSDANTKLLIHSNWTGGLGADSSGNYNYFTPTNLVAGDQVLDSPTNNWATCRLMNYPPSSGATFTEGNLYLTTGSSGGGRNTGRMAVSTILANSGKWYAELMVFSTTTFFCGVGTNQVSISSTSDNTRYAFVYGADGKVLLNTDGSESWVTYGSAFSTGDIVQIYIDMDASTPEVYFGKNGSWGDGSGNFDETTPTSAVVLGDTFFTADTDNAGFFEFQFSSASGGTSAQGQFNFGQDSTFSSQTAAGGYSDTNEIGDFKYTVPSGAKALCTDNLPDPEIALPGDYSNTILYTGDGATTQAITGLGFQPDFLWTKKRSATGFHCLVDSARGATNYLSSNSTNIEYDDAEYIASLDSDGFTVGVNTVTNDNTETFVAWNWKGGGAPTADNSAGAGAVPTAGSVKIDGSNLGSALAGTTAATRISANTTAGFSIVTYTGAGASGSTVAHGLSQAPELILYKNLDVVREWAVYSNQLTSNNYYLVLNGGAAEDTDSGRFNDTTPTASVFTLGDGPITNEDTKAQIAYCFHSVEGYSKVGRYTGNSSSDGTFVYTGFRPEFLITKNIEAATNWIMHDDKRPGYNVHDKSLRPDGDAASEANNEVDFLSNGFKWRGDNYPSWDQASNQSGEDYSYIAIASHPFKYSNAR